MISSLYEEDRLATLAARYRLGLDNQADVDTMLLEPIYKTLVLSQILNNFNGFEARVNDLLLSGDFNVFLKNLKTYSYSYFKNLNIYKSILKDKNLEIYNESKKIEELYNKQICNFLSIKKQLLNAGSDFFVQKKFYQRNLEEKYDLVDVKYKSYFKKSDLTENSFGSLRPKVRKHVKVTPIKASIIGNSTSGEKVETSKEMSFLWRPNKRFKYIVYKSEDRLRFSDRTEKASLNILFDFGFIEKINKIQIDEGSFLPVVIDYDELKYYDKNGEWHKVNVLEEVKNLKKRTLYIEEIEASELKLSFNQYKSLNKVSESFLTEEESFSLQVLNPRQNQNQDTIMYDVYDLSLDEVSFFYDVYSAKSLFREKDAIEVDKLKFLSLSDESMEQDSNCFIEAELEIQYYASDNNWSWTIIPYPRSYKIKERLNVKRRTSDFNISSAINSEV